MSPEQIKRAMQKMRTNKLNSFVHHLILAKKYDKRFSAKQKTNCTAGHANC